MYANLISPRPLKRIFCDCVCLCVLWLSQVCFPRFDPVELSSTSLPRTCNFLCRNHSCDYFLLLFFIHECIKMSKNFQTTYNIVFLSCSLSSLIGFCLHCSQFSIHFGIVSYMLRADDSMTFYISVSMHSNIDMRRNMYIHYTLYSRERHTQITENSE